MAGRLEDLPFDERGKKLDTMAEEILKIVETKGPMSSAAALQEATKNLGMAQSQVKFALSYAQSSGRIERDMGTWNLMAGSARLGAV